MNNNISKYGQPILAVALTLLINFFVRSRWTTLGQVHFLYNVALIFVIYFVVEQVIKFVFNNFINNRR